MGLENNQSSRWQQESQVKIKITSCYLDRKPLLHDAIMVPLCGFSIPGHDVHHQKGITWRRQKIKWTKCPLENLRGQKKLPPAGQIEIFRVVKKTTPKPQRSWLKSLKQGPSLGPCLLENVRYWKIYQHRTNSPL